MKAIEEDKRTRNPRGEGGRLREALLAAATELLAQTEDPEAVSVRAVTARVGVSPTALYLHFESREALAEEVRRRCFEQLGDAIRAADAAAGADPVARLRAGCAAYLKFARALPGHYAILFGAAKPDAPAEGKAGAGMEVFGLLVAAVERCGVVGGEAFELSVLGWMALHGRVAITAATPDFPEPTDERYLDLLVERLVGHPDHLR